MVLLLGLCTARFFLISIITASTAVLTKVNLYDKPSRQKYALQRRDAGVSRPPELMFSAPLAEVQRLFLPVHQPFDIIAVTEHY